MTTFRTGLLVLGSVVGMMPLPAGAEVVVVSRTAGGPWALQKIDSITVNGADRVRRVPAVGAAATWDSKAIGRLAHVDIDMLSAIRREADGRVVARQGASPEWFAVLPDNTKSQVAESAADLWAKSAIAIKRDKRTRTRNRWL